MEDKEKFLIAVVSFIAGLILAFIVYPKPEAETFYRTSTITKSDTIFINRRDTVYVAKTRIKTQVLRDTIVIDYKPKISAFKASFPFEHGSTHVSGEVLGEVLKMTAINDFKIPVVNTTVTETKTETIVKKPKGIYLGASVTSLLEPGIKASYLDNKYLFEYQFQPVTKIHALSVSKKLF